jgi:hypothetical protein
LTSTLFLCSEQTHLPIVADPSHGTGLRDWSSHQPGGSGRRADALILEVHPDPDTAVSDGRQSLTLEDFFCVDEKPAADRPGCGSHDLGTSRAARCSRKGKDAMMLLMKNHAEPAQIEAVVMRVEELGCKVHLSRREARTIIGVIGADQHLIQTALLR